MPTRAALLLTLVLGVAVPSRSVAQRQEFTQQTLLVAPFEFADSGVVRASRQMAANLRDRIGRLSNRRELAVVGTDTVEILLERAGFRHDIVMSEEMTLSVARRMRADEVLLARVSQQDGRFEVTSELALMRDWRLRQPLPAITGTSVRMVVDSLAAAVIAARSQMPGLRRCENAARASELSLAMTAAEEAIRLYPRSTLARTCLTMVLRYNNLGPDMILRSTDALLAIEPRNIVAAVLRANALSSLDQREDATAAWLRVVELRPDSITLAQAATDELMRLQRYPAVLDATAKLLTVHEGDLYLRRLRFRAHIALSAWPAAAALGDSLTIVDGDFDADSTYTVRHVEALRLSGDTLAALSRSARAVKQHRGDLSLYLQYISLVNAEHAIALPRGLALFPESSDLNVLAAREAMTAGRRQAAIASFRSAVRNDPTLLNGYLQMATLFNDEQQPDSVVSTIVRAPRDGNPSLVRSYALSAGRQMLRGASDTTTAVWNRAAVLFYLADSLDSQEDSRGLIAAATLSLARAELMLSIPDRSCTHAERANAVLGQSASVLERGVGSGPNADQLTEVFGSLRESVDNAKRVFCATPPPPGS